MKSSETMSVGEIIDVFFKHGGNEDAFKYHKIASLWPQVAGATLADATLRCYASDHALHVYISSAPVKSELKFVADALVRRLNEAAGDDIINRIIIH